MLTLERSLLGFYHNSLPLFVVVNALGVHLPSDMFTQALPAATWYGALLGL